MDQRINSVLVGLNFGQWVIEHELLTAPGRDYIRLSGVCDLDVGKARECARRFGVKVYEDLEQVLLDDSVEAVILITGPKGRSGLIQRILDAGKAVMTTKPFETDSEAAARVLERAFSQGKVLHMNSPSPLSSPDLKQIEKWMEEYSLGRLIAYRGATWCSYREKPDGSWYDDPRLCPAAPLTRLGVYLLNDICRFTAPVKKMDVQESRIFTERPTADNAQVSLLHEDGVLGNVFASFCIGDQQYYRCSLEMNFENGTVYRNVGPKRSDLIQMEMAANAGGVLKVQSVMFENTGAGYQWDTFYRAVRENKRESTVTAEQIVSVLRILEGLDKGLKG